MKILFSFLFYPLSLLPHKILYGIAQIIFFFLFHIFHYREKIIDKNLLIVFPEKSENERKIVKKDYYKHLSELVVEMIKMLTISKYNLKKHYYCSNPELVNDFFKNGKSVILMSSHLNNWEWMVLGLDDMFDFHGIGIGAPNSNKSFEKLINKARTRYGTEVIFASSTRTAVQNYFENKIPVVYMILSDQSPSNVKKSYITNFFNKPSAILYGAEYFARKYNFPVIYYQVIKEKKGYYRVDFKLITDCPIDCVYGYIIKTYLQCLEKSIILQPESWLWSHNRWKLKIDNNKSYE